MFPIAGKQVDACVIYSQLAGQTKFTKVVLLLSL